MLWQALEILDVVSWLYLVWMAIIIALRVIGKCLLIRCFNKLYMFLIGFRSGELASQVIRLRSSCLNS